MVYFIEMKFADINMKLQIWNDLTCFHWEFHWIRDIILKHFYFIDAVFCIENQWRTDDCILKSPLLSRKKQMAFIISNKFFYPAAPFS